MAKTDKYAFFEKVTDDVRREHPTELSETLAIIEKKRLAEKAPKPMGADLAAKKLAMTGLIDAATDAKKKMEKWKNPNIANGIELGGIIITKEDLEALEDITADINETTLYVKLHVEHNMKLMMTAMQIRRKYKLPNKSGINITKLVYLILQKVLENVKI